MSSYHDTIKQLISVMTLLNRADSDNAESWQRAEDACGPFRQAEAALRALAGDELVDHWAETAELELSLASR